MLNYRFRILFILLINSFLVSAQQPAKPNSVEIYNQIKKLNFLGSVLYLAAHPDDENTRLISYFSNEVHARTGYLSLTRGDGGQNLIGSELREGLGVIRTQELLEARKIDGGEQFFSRANDFGYSKNPDETLEIWDKNKVLSDVVWAIRNFQPDVIINRFDHRSPGTTHGHHTASAMLSFEAFDKTNDKTVFPEQLNFVSTWQAKRLYFNTSWWFFGSKEKFDAADKSNLTEINSGVYFPEMGKSNQEIAALSRSKHQSQGFGSSGARGDDLDYLEFLKGEKPTNKANLFEGIDTTWNRVENGAAIGTILANVEKNFDFKNPSASVSELVKAYNLIYNLKENHWRNIKIEEIKNIIAACSGLYLDAFSDVQEATLNSNLNIKLEVINRSKVPMTWENYTIYPTNDNTEINLSLAENKDIIKDAKFLIPDTENYTQPYYLDKKGTDGVYRVDDQLLIGKPEISRANKVAFFIEIAGTTIPFIKNIVYKTNDNVKGEIYQPLDIVPDATVNFSEKVYLFPDKKTKAVSVKVKSGKDNCIGNVRLKLPENWTVSPENFNFKFDKKDEEQIFIFNVSPSRENSEIDLKSEIEIDDKIISQSKTDIDYPHINKQIILMPSEAKGIRFDLKTKNEKIAYIMGAGDEVPKSLQQMGYSVTLLKPVDININSLKKFDVVITGIRAYNVLNDLAFKQNLLFDFVKSGKTMIVQYNTTGELVTNDLAPFPLKISRDRVTEENAEVRFIDPKNKILHSPNEITSKDFEGWTQEQGLYYPNEFDKNFTPILSSNDKGETPKNGALLVAKYGKGTYIYTGLSFFRELPAGVSGAFRLMANLISSNK